MVKNLASSCLTTRTQVGTGASSRRFAGLEGISFDATGDADDFSGLPVGNDAEALRNARKAMCIKTTTKDDGVGGKVVVSAEPGCRLRPPPAPLASSSAPTVGP